MKSLPAAIALMAILAGCTVIVETRSSAECTVEQCKAESSMKRSGEQQAP